MWWWNKLTLNSETIVWGRIQMLIGIVAIAAAAIDWSPILPQKYVPLALLVSGVITEVARRLRDPHLGE